MREGPGLWEGAKHKDAGDAPCLNPTYSPFILPPTWPITEKLRATQLGQKGVSEN